MNERISVAAGVGLHPQIFLYLGVRKREAWDLGVVMGLTDGLSPAPGWQHITGMPIYVYVFLSNTPSP